MPLTVTYLNERLQIFEGAYGVERQAEFEAVSRLYNRRIGPVRTLHLAGPDPGRFSMYTGSCGHSPIELLVPDLTVQPLSDVAMAIPEAAKG